MNENEIVLDTPNTDGQPTDAMPPANVEGNAESTDGAENNNDEPAADPSAVVVVMEQPQAKVPDTIFTLSIKQHDENHQLVTAYSIKFSLQNEVAANVDYIIGTALNKLYSNLDLAKGMNTKIFKGKLPLEVCITSDQYILDFGGVQQVFLEKLKLNSGERSKLSFIDRMILITNSMLQPIQTVRATDLRLRQMDNVKYAFPDKKVKGLASVSAIRAVSSAVMEGAKQLEDKK